MVLDPDKAPDSRSRVLPADFTDFTRRIIGAAIEARRNRSPGLRERTHGRAPEREPMLTALRVDRRIPRRVHTQGADRQVGRNVAGLKGGITRRIDGPPNSTNAAMTITSSPSSVPSANPL